MSKIKVKFSCFWQDSAVFGNRQVVNWGPPPERFEIVSGNEYDYLIVCSGSQELYNSPREKNIGFTMEPSWSPNVPNDFAERCAVLVTSHERFKGSNVQQRPICMLYQDSEPDYGAHTMQWHMENTNFEKPYKLSIVVRHHGNELRNCWDGKTQNYFYRDALVPKIFESDLDCHVYGIGWGEPGDPRWKGMGKPKNRGLQDYEYSIAIENCNERNYVTEKLFDCFINNCVPIYYGCPNVDEIYDSRSFVHFDPSSPTVIEDLKKIIATPNSVYKEHVLASKKRYFEEYSMWRYLDQVIPR